MSRNDDIGPQPGESPSAYYDVRSPAALLGGVFERASKDRPQRGVPCGHHIIDRLIGGFRPGRVTVVGAGTSWGKSSFAIMTTDVGLRVGARIMLISVEDTEDTYGQRLMARRAGINAMRLRDRRLTCDDLDEMARVVESAEKDPYFFWAGGKPVEWIAKAIRGVVGEEGIDLVIVDYLQAITTTKRTQDRRNEITHIARVLVDAIKNSGAAGLLFSQLKRLDDGRPTMHDLKESGDLENMAEHVLIGYRATPKGAAPEDEKRYLLIEKNKDGPVLREPIEMPFNMVTASFLEQRA